MHPPTTTDIDPGRFVTSADINFNQFTYWGLRRHPMSLGFTRVIDRFEYTQRSAAHPAKQLLLRMIRSSRQVGALARAFDTGTSLICVK